MAVRKIDQASLEKCRKIAKAGLTENGGTPSEQEIDKVAYEAYFKMVGARFSGYFRFFLLIGVLLLGWILLSHGNSWTLTACVCAAVCVLGWILIELYPTALWWSWARSANRSG